MKKLYRFAGVSIRNILGENPHLCCVVELQHVSGALYHYHKDFPSGRGLAVLPSLMVGVEITKVAQGKTVPGWELRDEPRANDA